MRNVDKIKQLQHELGRYEKKVADQAKEIARLQEKDRDAGAGLTGLSRSMDATLACVALKYGEVVKDEETSEVLGYRLELGKFDIEQTLAQYTVHTGWNEDKTGYTVGVMAKEKA